MATTVYAYKIPPTIPLSRFCVHIADTGRGHDLASSITPNYPVALFLTFFFLSGRPSSLPLFYHPPAKPSRPAIICPFTILQPTRRRRPTSPPHRGILLCITAPPNRPDRSPSRIIYQDIKTSQYTKLEK